MRLTTLAVAAALLGAACKLPDKTQRSSDMPPAPPAPAAATKVLAVDGFLAPESVLYDSTQDIYFVSSIAGSGTAKDDNGFISRLRPDGAIENLKFIEGGKNGVTLNAPKGLAIVGDTLWVADIDEIGRASCRERGESG